MARILLPVALAATLAAVVAYRQAARHDGWLRWARLAFFVQAGCVQVAAAVLMNAVLTHRFDLDYVFAHSSTDLPFFYLAASFWSGQEGTFLLWAGYGCFIGAALIARSGEWEATVMAVWCVLQALVLALLVVHSPFVPLDLRAFSPADLAIFAQQFGGLPPEGQGLNPLLQNPWMVIHPPILFLGFALLGVPFTFAVAGLLRGELDEWARRARRWTLLAWVVLGGGLILGGYWAYETLGWGGYWAWDPVENSSLAPWLLAGALFHALVLQRVTGGRFRALGLVLAPAAYFSVTYGSYLNRSGVLSDFSVHSFVALSPSFNRALIAFAAAPLVIYAVAWLRSRPSAPPVGEGQPPAWSRQWLLGWCVLLLSGSGVIVLAGNSWPLLSRLVGKPSSLQPSFYNAVHTPLVMLIAALLAVVMHVGWRAANGARLWRGLRGPLAMGALTAVVATVSVIVFVAHRGEHRDWMLPSATQYAAAWVLVLTLCAISAAANAAVLWDDLRAGRRQTIGTHLAHLGFMVLVSAAVVSSVYTTKAIVRLPLGEAREFSGYAITYRGLRIGARSAKLELAVRNGGVEQVVAPVLRPAKEGLVRTPAILKSLACDLYLEPGEIERAGAGKDIALSPTRSAQLGEAVWRFRRFKLEGGPLDPNDIRVRVVIEVTSQGQAGEVRPEFRMKNGEVVSPPEPVPGGGMVTVTGLQPQAEKPEERLIMLRLEGVPGAGEPEAATVQVTVKPVMSVFWFGCWLVLAGGLMAAGRRR